MADPKFLKFDTLSLHAGQRPDPTTGARAVPIYQTTSYVFRDTDHAAALFNLERAGHIYSRISNPTAAVLEERVAALEQGVGAVATASGQAALHLAIIDPDGQGGHIVASSSLYGGSVNLLALTLPRFGIETTFVKPRDLKGIEAAIRPETRLIFAETLGNPGLEVLDIPAVAEIAHRAGLPLMIDNTFATPTSAGRRVRLPTWSCIRRPSGSAATVWRSAACWSTAAASTGRRAALPDPDRALCRLPRHRLRRGVRPPGLPCGPGPRACATSAPP